MIVHSTYKIRWSILNQHVGGTSNDLSCGVLDQDEIVLQVVPAVGAADVEAGALALDVESVDQEVRSIDVRVQFLQKN